MHPSDFGTKSRNPCTAEYLIVRQRTSLLEREDESLTVLIKYVAKLLSTLYLLKLLLSLRRFMSSIMLLELLMNQMRITSAQNKEKDFNLERK